MKIWSGWNGQESDDSSSWDTQSKIHVFSTLVDCKYSYGDWSSCNPTSNMRSKTGKLDKGDPAVCEATKTVTKTCSIKGGKGG